LFASTLSVPLCWPVFSPSGQADRDLFELGDASFWARIPPHMNIKN